jgi:hypothetical protein
MMAPSLAQLLMSGGGQQTTPRMQRLDQPRPRVDPPVGQGPQRVPMNGAQRRRWALQHPPHMLPDNGFQVPPRAPGTGPL